MPAAASSGFIYASALMGVTGIRGSVGEAAGCLVRRINSITELPVCIGIGISNAAQAAQVAGVADGVIVGSAMVKAILGAPGQAVRGAQGPSGVHGQGRLARLGPLDEPQGASYITT